MRPKALARHAAHQHKSILITNDSHAAIVRPSKVRHAYATIVYELDGPATLIFYPNINDAFRVACGQLLIGLFRLLEKKNVLKLVIDFFLNK